MNYHPSVVPKRREGHQQRLWRRGSLECVFVTTDCPRQYAVEVLNNSRALVAERCENPDDAPVVAALLWDLLVKPPQ